MGLLLVVETGGVVGDSDWLLGVEIVGGGEVVVGELVVGVVVEVVVEG